MLINLRIAETALARAGALERRLGRLTGADIRDASLAAREFSDDVRFAGEAPW